MEITKKYTKNYHYKRKDLLNNLITCVEELENELVGNFLEHFRNYGKFLNFWKFGKHMF